VPLLTDSRAYSTWYNRPCVSKTVTLVSYPRPPGCMVNVLMLSRTLINLGWQGPWVSRHSWLS